MQQIASGCKSAEVTSATRSALMLRLLTGIGWGRAYLPVLKTITDPLERTARSRAVFWHTAGIAISGPLVHDYRPGWEMVAQLYSGCESKAVSNPGVVPSERYRKFGLSAGDQEFETGSLLSAGVITNLIAA